MILLQYSSTLQVNKFLFHAIAACCSPARVSFADRLCRQAACSAESLFGGEPGPVYEVESSGRMIEPGLASGPCRGVVQLLALRIIENNFNGVHTEHAAELRARPRCEGG